MTVDALVDVADLAREVRGPRPPTLLDVRWRLAGPPGIEDYRAGHVPGAVFVDLDRDLAAPPGGGGRHPLPAAESFQATMRRAGVRDGWPVVVYDEADSTAAARAWWVLRYFGHDRVRVLDGGYQAWAAAGGPVARGDRPVPPEAGADAGKPAVAGPGGARTAPPAGPPSGRGAERTGDFTARPGQMPLLDAAGAARTARSGVLLDARAAERYRGEVEPMDPVAGHIPGAVSAPTSANVGPDGRFLPPADLRRRFAALGVSGAAPAGAYCGSGVTAAHEVLALALAGIPAALYVGSWSHWITDPARPVATGPGE